MIKKKPIINIAEKKLFTSIKESAEFYCINKNKLSKMCKDKNSQFRLLRVEHKMVLRGRDISKLHIKVDAPIKEGIGRISDARVIQIFTEEELEMK